MSVPPWVREPDPEHQLAAAAKNLLLRLGVPYDDGTVERELVEMPGYPGPAALVAALMRWGVSCAAVSVPLDALGELPMPCLARDADERYFLVLEVENGVRARILDPSSGPEELAWPALAERWSGTTIAAEVNEGADARSPRGQADDRAAARRRRAMWSLLAVAATALLAAAVTRATDLTAPAWAIAQGLALAGSLALFLAARGGDCFANRFCPRTTCGKLLRSATVRIGPVAPWDLGIVYSAAGLSTTLLSWVASPADAASLRWLLSVAAIAVLPAAAWFLVRLARSRHRCRLCIGVQALLWAQAALALQTLAQARAPSATTALVVLTVGLACVLCWAVLADLLRRGLREPEVQRAAFRLKREPQRVAALIERAGVRAPPAGPIEISDGDADAPQRVTVVADLGGQLSAEAFFELFELAGADVQVRFCLYVFYALDGVRRSITQRLCELVAAGDHAGVRVVLISWYRGRLEGRPDKGSVVPRSREGEALEARYLAWCNETKLSHVPAIYVGDHQVPKVLEVADLEPWLRDAAQQAEPGDEG